MINEKQMEAFFKVRDTGLINMYDKDGCILIMKKLGYIKEAEYFIDNNKQVSRKRYAELLEAIRNFYSTIDILAGNKDGRN